MTNLAMIVPTRGRPESVARMAEAWEETNGDNYADLWWIIDADDPQLAGYQTAIEAFPWMKAASIPSWRPMVPKLNWAARALAGQYKQLGFMGDDHLPRTFEWSLLLAAELSSTKVEIAYGRDGFQDQKLPTWWAMTTNIVDALGCMVPGLMQHLYCDNAIKLLGERSKTLVYLPDVEIEHMHPIAGKAEWDEGHRRVNRGEQYQRDKIEFDIWVRGGLERDATLIAQL